MRLLRRHGGWTASTDAASDLLDMLQGAVLVLREVERAARELPEGDLDTDPSRDARERAGGRQPT